MTDRIPRAVRPLHSLYLAVAETICDDRYLNWSESDFIYELIKKSHGNISIAAAKYIYRELMEDAGLEPKIDD